MSLQKETQIQFRTNKEIKEAVKDHCKQKYINMSAYITSLIVKDLKITPPTKELIYGVDWEL